MAIVRRPEFISFRGVYPSGNVRSLCEPEPLPGGLGRLYLKCLFGCQSSNIYLP